MSSNLGRVVAGVALACVVGAPVACRSRGGQGKRGEGPKVVVTSTPTAQQATPPASAAPRRADAKAKPNILFVISDDQRGDTLACMPKLKRLIGERATTFRQNFATTPLCCPGRSSVLTGKYAHNHRVLSNGDIEDEDGDKSPGAIDFRDNGNEEKTVAGWLQTAGYRTGYFGKYLNAYDKLVEKVPNHVPPHWDEWRAFTHAEFFDFELVERGMGEAVAKRRCYLSNEKPDGDEGRGGRGRRGGKGDKGDKGGEGKREARKEKKCMRQAAEVVRDGRENYSTDVLAEQVVSFVRRASAEGKPWFVHLAPKAPHGPFLSPARYQPDPAVAEFTKEAQERLASCSLFDWKDRPPSFLEDDMSDKPQWLQEAKGPRVERARLERVRKMQLASVLATEDAVESIMTTLQQLGVAEDTVVVYTADNGFAWGEHWHTHKNCAYEECARVPLLVRDPRVTGGPRTVDAFTLNIDLAPSFAAWAGAKVPGDVNGKSLLGLVDGSEKAWPRREVLTECWGPGTEGRPDTHAAVRTERWKFVRHYADPARKTVRTHRAGGPELELYDLSKDPFELDNLLRLAPDALARTGHTRAEVDAAVGELSGTLTRLERE